MVSAVKLLLVEHDSLLLLVTLLVDCMPLLVSTMYIMMVNDIFVGDSRMLAVMLWLVNRDMVLILSVKLILFAVKQVVNLNHVLQLVQVVLLMDLNHELVLVMIILNH